MADYIKWNCRGIENGNEALRETQSRLSSLADELRSIGRRLDPQLAEYDGIERSLRTLIEGTEEDSHRIRNECNALDGVYTVYTGAERAALRASESLPVSITERDLVFERWFTELLG